MKKKTGMSADVRRFFCTFAANYRKEVLIIYIKVKILWVAFSAQSLKRTA